MEDAALGIGNIGIDIVGYDTEQSVLVLQLPSGVLIRAVVSKPDFRVHIKPLIENPPPPKQLQVASSIKEQQPVIDAPKPEQKQDQVSQVSDDLWFDPMSMFIDIKAYAKYNDRSIIPDERPGTNRMAWKCKNTGKSWSVSLPILLETLNKLAASPDPTDQSKAFHIRKCISTIEGRQRLCDSFNAQ